METSSLLIESLRLGMISTSERLGADMIVVPKNYVSSIQDALFLGKPCTVYFHKNWVDKIKKMEGVKRVTYQMYLATLSESECCDSAIQMIAYDPATDYIIQPWIKKNTTTALKGKQIIIGNHLNYNPGDVAKFYGEEFIVAAKMDKTGMGYDNSVFLSYGSALDLAKKPVVKNNFSIGDNENMISMIAIEIEEDYDIGFVSDLIMRKYGDDEVAIYESNRMLNGLSKNLNQYTAYSYILNSLLTISTIFSLLCIYYLIINERKREFGIFRTIGADRIRVIQIIVGEAVMISIVGCFLGTILSGVLIFSFHNYIAQLLKVPFLLPPWRDILMNVGKVMLVSLFSGIFSSLFAAVKINMADIYYLIRSNEA
jgi:putative ABC transport system permease protein